MVLTLFIFILKDSKIRRPLSSVNIIRYIRLCATQIHEFVVFIFR
jgi:hypothetical protein